MWITKDGPVAGAPEPIRPVGELCGHRQWCWPYKSCTLKPRHDGDHCNIKQCGDRLVDTWWSREKPEDVR